MSVRTPFPQAENPRRFWIVGVAVGLVALWLALAGVQAGLAWSEMAGARDLATEGREALLDGDAAAAEDAFARARGDLESAHGRLAGWTLAPVRLVPVVGSNVDALTDLADGGARLAEAGAVAAGGIADLPDGLSSLVPRDGGLPLEPLTGLEPTVVTAREAVERADAAVGDTPPARVLRPVAEAYVEMGSRTEEAGRVLDTAGALVEALPEFLGAEGPRRYFLGAQNPAELRGTGGLIGAFAEVTAEDGRVEVGEFKPVQDLPTVPAEDAPAPSEEFAARYNRYGGAGFWLTINMTPHGPSAARAIEGLYRQVTGTQLDGTILVAPEMLAGLLRVTGPVEVPATDLTVDADSAVRILANEAYTRIEDPETRKRLLGDTAGRALSRFLDGRVDAEPSSVLRALGDAATSGSLLVHARDERLQAAFERAGVTASLTPEGTDFLAVVVNNAAANKADYYAERAVRYEVDLEPGGAAQSRVSVDLANHAPTRGERYVIGPNVDTARAGENRSLLSVYCAAGCRRTDFRRSVGRQRLREERERGLPVFTTMVQLTSGEEGRVELDFSQSDAWEDRGDVGVYELTLRGQPTVRPTRTEVVVTVPEGARIRAVDPGGEVSATDVRWVAEGLWERSFRVTFAS